MPSQSSSLASLPSPPTNNAFEAAGGNSSQPAQQPLVASASFLKDALKRSPFLFVAKTTPKTLPVYDVNLDFRYFFICDHMASFSCLHSKFLRRAEATRRKTNSDLGGMFSVGVTSRRTSAPEENTDTVGRNPDGVTKPLVAAAEARAEPADCIKPVNNARLLFPQTYEHIFDEDLSVVADHQYPSTLDVVERCVRPGVDTLVYTTKTAAEICGHTFILVASSTYDDVEMQITKFKSGRLAAEIADLGDVPLRWFEGAFVSFPLSMAVVDGHGNLVKLNEKMLRWEEWQGVVAECMEEVREVRKIDRSKDVWEFSGIAVPEDENGAGCRVWVWKPVIDRDLYAICFRRHHNALAGANGHSLRLPCIRETEGDDDEEE